MFNQLEELNKHQIIGLDMDETLIEGPCSYLLREWVKENFIKKELWIITFRTGPYVAQVWGDLAPYRLGREQFAGLKAIPPHLHSDYWLIKKGFAYKDSNPGKFERFLAANKLTPELAQKKHDALLHWKGEACASVGATVLVDDLPDMVLPGCIANNIQFINAHRL